MASHSGLKYILETKKGYVKEDGSFTNKESEAMLIDFNQFGFGTKAIEVYQLLGFDDQEIKNGDASFRVMLPSYESRDGIGINYYYLMGCDYKSAIIKSRRDYMFYNLQDDNNCLKYKDMLKTKVLDYYKNTEKIAKTLKIGKQEIPLYKTNDEDMQLLEGELKYYYSEMGRVYKYTVP